MEYRIKLLTTSRLPYIYKVMYQKMQSKKLMAMTKLKLPWQNIVMLEGHIISSENMTDRQITW